MSTERTAAADLSAIATDSIGALYALGARLEDRGHDDSTELALVMVGRAVADAVRELAAEVRESRPATGEVADAVDGVTAALGRLGTAVTDAS